MFDLNDLNVPVAGSSIYCQSLEIMAGECVALVGESGIGKTTFMESICGIRGACSGEILLDGIDVNLLPAECRSIGLVPQDTILFPGLSVSQQIGFGMKMAGYSKLEQAQRVEELAVLFKMESLLLQSSEKLSGGQAKCVAILRALASQPKLLCLDECFNGLDKQLKNFTMATLKEWIKREGIPTLLIAHQQDEVEEMANGVHQLKDDEVVKLV